MLATIKCNLQRHSKYLFCDRSNFLQRLTVILLTIILFAIAPNARSTSFTITGDSTTRQILSTGETGTINSGASLTISGGVSAIRASSASNITVLNNGTITTSSNGSRGISSISNSGTSTFTNSGTINTNTGAFGYGIFSLTNSGTQTITNSGTITTGGEYSYGIHSINNSGTANITNSGTITTSGPTAHGIYVYDSEGTRTVTNSGTINVTGTSSVGVLIKGPGTFNNSGTISATGDATKAIEFDPGDYDNTLNLLSGSNITGTIDLGGGTDTVNISGTQVINGCEKSACMSASLFTNAEIINIDPSVDAVVSSGVVATVDPTGSSVLGVSLSTMTSAVHDVVSQRMARTRTSRMPVSGRGLSSWGQTIGAYRSRGTEGSAMGHNHSYVGFTGGTEKS